MDWRNGKFQTLIVPLHNRIPKGLRTLRSPSLKIDLVNFMRFMTKIALSEFYRATRIRFFEDDALDFVLGQNLDFTLFCGVSNIAGPRNKLHDVSVKKISIDNPVFKGVAGRVDIRLFAFLKSPTYTFILRPKRSIV